jgi:DNA-binding phage protein
MSSTINPIKPRNFAPEILEKNVETKKQMLLNEFLKEHREIQEQKAIIAQLKSVLEKQETANVRQQKQIEALTRGLQKVSAEVEMSRPAPQVVVK